MKSAGFKPAFFMVNFHTSNRDTAEQSVRHSTAKKRKREAFSFRANGEVSAVRRMCAVREEPPLKQPASRRFFKWSCFASNRNISEHW